VSEPVTATAPLIEAVGVHRVFERRHGLGLRTSTVHAVNGVDLEVHPGEVLGLVGESGCGKSTLGRVMLGLLQPTSGEVRFDGRVISGLGAGEMKPLRRQMQVIFQDPFASLNPHFTVEQILTEPLLIHRSLPRSQWKDRIRELIEQVGIGEEALRRRPGQFSGGQQQRIAIARALALNPRLIVADEALSALDVSIQAQVLNLFMDIQREFGIAYLFISHNLVVVRHISHRIAVMYLGRVVELGRAGDLYGSPKHPYTVSLLSAVPHPNPRVERARRRITVAGDPPDASRLPGGCPFHPRCWKAQDVCRTDPPPLRPMGPADHVAACHFPE
jgi:peptide/nickel transport system ATP-binding protein